MLYEIEVKASAIRELKDLPKIIGRRIARTVESLASNPLPAGCKKLKGDQNLYRVRVGDYRIVYARDAGRSILTIMRVAHRKDVYR